MKKKLLLLCLISSLFFFMGIASAKPPGPAEALQLLGKSIYNDKNLSLNFNQSCKTCHHNNYGFVDPANAKNPSKNVVSVGSDTNLTGGLNAPTAAYAAFSPAMDWDGDLFIGGIFWNGRAHGHKEFDVDCKVKVNDYAPGEVIYSPLAEQAQGPFTNPVEMALPDNAEVVKRVESYLLKRPLVCCDLFAPDGQSFSITIQTIMGTTGAAIDGLYRPFRCSVVVLFALQFNISFCAFIDTLSNRLVC